MFRNILRARWSTSSIAVTAIALVAGVSGLGLIASPASADTAPTGGLPATVSADALPTWQINGVVWAQVIVGNTVYVTGSFTRARPPGVAAGGAGEIAANNLFAYDITTGNRVASFSHSLNGQGLTMAKSPDGSRVYVGGDFTTADGAARNHLAAFDTATGALVSSFAPSLSARVGGITVSPTTVYVGGTFASAGAGAPRNRLAAFNASTGALLPWAPSADNSVAAMVMAPDNSRVIVGGSFATLNGQSQPASGALDASSGAVLPWALNQVFNNSGTGGGVTALRSDGTQIYGSGYAFRSGNFEGTFGVDPYTGAVHFINDCHGDTYDVAPIGQVLYSVSHAHSCQWIGAYPNSNPWQINMHHAVAFTTYPTGTNTGPDDYGWNYNGQPDSTILDWFPVVKIGTFTGQSQAAWAVNANSSYVVLGGEFPSVNGTAQQGLVRFAAPNIAPNKTVPLKCNAAPVPTAKSVSAGTARISWQAAYDMDNEHLTYNVYRSGTTAPVYTTTQDSTFWNCPGMGYIDSGLTPGATYTYTVKATDPFNNTYTLPKTNAVTISNAVLSNYAKDVLNDGASSFWRLDEPSGSTVVGDSAGFGDATASAGVTRAVTGAIAGDSDTASSFNGGSDGFAATNSSQDPTPNFSIESWVKTTSHSGGKIVGYGNSPTGTSSSYDRHIYMDNAGHIIFGIYNNGVYTATTPGTYNDGAYHQIVATMDATKGMVLYVDGKKIAMNGSGTVAQAYTGYWRIGGDNLGGWPSQPSSNFLNGSIDEVSIYPSALALAKVQQHYIDGGGTLNLPQPPADNYGKAVFNSGPDLYWRIDETNGTSAADTSGNANPGVYAGGVTLNQPGGVAGTPNKAASFNGSDGTIGSANQVAGPSVYSEELWFKTSTSSGGKLIGFGDQPSGYSSNYDRHVYMENSGQLTFGVWTGFTNTATSPLTYNNGAWHYMVATQGSDGMHLYVDGVEVANNPQASQQPYQGYWRVGGDSDWGGDSAFLNGSIDEVAVYSSELAPADVKAHYLAGGGTLSNQLPIASFTHSEAGLNASFDGSASSDPDGTIASYAWDFGDGGSGTGATTSHTYAHTGDYTVALTVTDNQGGTKTSSTSIHVTNSPPVAAFTSTTNGLTVSVDGSGSNDADGSIASYDWNWGDGTGHGSGVSPNHTYAGGGTRTITLTVTDNDTGTGTVSHDVNPAAQNQAPNAVFTSTTSDLTASVNGGGSNDPDGSIASYDWNWGDSTAHGSGVSPNHTYASGGTKTIVLTVTDNAGGTGTVSHDVTVTSPTPTLLASDDFGRSVTNDWGTADIGGPWVTTGPKTDFSVVGGVGKILTPTAPSGPSVSLNSVSTTNSDTRVSVAVDKAATGSGLFVSVLGRTVGTTGSYRGVLNYLSTGKVTLGLVRVDGAGQAKIAPQTAISGLTVAPGDVLDLRVVVAGTSPTTLMAKVWKDGTSEPAAWQVTGSDAAAGMQSAGSVGLLAFLSANATNAPVTTSVDAFTVSQDDGQQGIAPQQLAALAAKSTAHKSTVPSARKRTSPDFRR